MIQKFILQSKTLLTHKGFKLIWIIVKKCKHMSIGSQSVINSYTITDANDVTHSLSVRKILESGYLLYCIQVFNAKNLMLRQCKALLLLNEHSNTLQKNHLTSLIKHTSNHILNTVFRPGAHIMPNTLTY